MKGFTFRSPRIVFKRDAIPDIIKACSAFGRRGIIISSSSFKANDASSNALSSQFKAEAIETECITRRGFEPTVDEVDAMASIIKRGGFEWVLGIGGGSTLDLAKAAAGLALNDGSAARYQKGTDVPNPGIPFIAVPTTAGTGSEITNNAVLINNDENVKLSIRGDALLARVAVLDPLLTASMPPAITAHTGLDALVQAVEAYVSKASNPLSDTFAERAIEIIWQWLPRAFDDGKNLDAREMMLYGSMLSALSFSNAKLGAVHGFAHPIGVQHRLSHGLVCGVLLPHVMRFNLEGNIPEVTRKYAWMGKTFARGETVDDASLANKAIEHIFSLLDALHLPRRLSSLGLNESHVPAIVADTKGGSLGNNPRDATPQVLATILRDAM